MAARSRFDYDRIEASWRAGLLSPRSLAAVYTEETGDKISHAAIIKHFAAKGVPRDLSAKIKAKSDAMVTRAMVTQEVTSESRIRDCDIVDGAADMLTSVRLSHRKDIQRKRSIVARLMDELEAQVGTDSAALLADLGEIMREPDDSGQDKRNDLYRKIISLPERAKTAKTLAETLRLAVDMERQAFGMDAKDADKAQPGAAGYVPPSITVLHVTPPPRRPDDDEDDDA